MTTPRKTLPKSNPRSVLLSYQRDWSEDDARFKIGLMARQVGKDFSSGDEMTNDVLRAEARGEKCTWLLAAPSERQSLESLEKTKEWTAVKRLDVANLIEDRVGGSETLLKSATIVFPKGSRIIAVPGRPETVRGFSANVLLTEAAFFEDLRLTLRAVLPSITNPLRGGLKKLRLISTPNGRGDRFEEIWSENFEKTDAKWSCHKVTIWDAVRQGLPVDPEEIRAALNDPIGWAQEYECEFLDTSNVLLPYDVLALAESAEATELCDPAFWLARGGNPVFLGIDFGRTNDPTVCWGDEIIGDVAWAREVLRLENVSTPNQLEVLRIRIRRATRVCFDYTGPGIGLGDLLVKEFGQYDPTQHLFGKIELCTFTTKFKRELFPKLRRQFDAPVKSRTPISRWIREDLHAMQQIVQNGEYNYWAPRTKEGHSDACTAKALCTRARGTGGGPTECEPVRRARSLVHSGSHDLEREMVI
jgi:phage FluMu gp28-like protein